MKNKNSFLASLDHFFHSPFNPFTPNSRLNLYSQTVTSFSKSEIIFLPPLFSRFAYISRMQSIHIIVCRSFKSAQYICSTLYFTCDDICWMSLLVVFRRTTDRGDWSSQFSYWRTRVRISGQWSMVASPDSTFHLAFLLSKMTRDSFQAVWSGVHYNSMSVTFLDHTKHWTRMIWKITHAQNLFIECHSYYSFCFRVSLNFRFNRNKMKLLDKKTVFRESTIVCSLCPFPSNNNFIL